ncbi:MAG: SH3 domain-containing protein [Lachnospiraceae bacterium]|nr:SH3 domain-containing protein [Lachnospiraceae bacterium]
MSDKENKPTDILSEFLEQFHSNDKVKYGVIGGGLALVLILIIIICVSCSKNGNGKEGAGNLSDNAVTVNAQPETDLVPTSDEAILQLINTYYTALAAGDLATIQSVKDNVSEESLIKIETRAQYTESVDNIQVYTRPGPEEGSTVAFVYYELKYYDIETRAPGLITIYIRQRDDGSLYICEGEDWDDEVSAYINEIAAEETIADFFTRVQESYDNALGQDVALKLRMEGMGAVENEAIAARAEGGQTGEQPGTAQGTAVNETVVATTKVNVRASDSENADRIGQVEEGAKLTRYEVRNNGWSRIDYNGQEGYIKSEYLKAEASEQPAAQEPAPQPEAAEQPAEQTSTQTASGKVTAKESVRVRASASTSGDVLGMAYEGESYDLIMEQADGWCKISYHGKTGYVKTEFVDIN